MNFSLKQIRYFVATAQLGQVSRAADQLRVTQSAVTISIRDLVALMCDQTGVKFEDFAEIVADRPGKDSAYLLDATLARTKLGWQDRVSLEEGIADTKRWIDANLDVLRGQPANYVHKA